MTAPAIWQEVEFGSYGADLPALGRARRGRAAAPSSSSARAPAASRSTWPGTGMR